MEKLFLSVKVNQGQEVKGSRGQIVKRSKGQEVKGSRGQEVVIEWMSVIGSVD